MALHQQLKNKPVSSAKALGAAARLSAPTTNRAIERLAELGIVREVTAKKRSRVFAYQPLIGLLQADLQG